MATEVAAEAAVRDRIRALVLEMAPEAGPGTVEDAHLVQDLGYHSLALLELAFALEDEFDIPPIDEASVGSIRTTRDIEVYVLSSLAMAPTTAGDD